MCQYLSNVAFKLKAVNRTEQKVATENYYTGIFHIGIEILPSLLYCFKLFMSIASSKFSVTCFKITYRFYVKLLSFEVFWVVTLCRVEVEYLPPRGPCCSVFTHIHILPQHYTVSQARKPRHFSPHRRESLKSRINYPYCVVHPYVNLVHMKICSSLSIVSCFQMDLTFRKHWTLSCCLTKPR
jgi:hypothetical protein